tara:strand:+ start:242 stop:3043 length:2802 start_codon:yes stop_codon:yes gene_type:complete
VDNPPNTRPGLVPAIAAAGVLLVVLTVLFYPVFSGAEVLHTEGRTVGEWDQHFTEGSWNSKTGLGIPTGHTPPGFTGLFEELCRLTPDPASNFANYYPPACLFLLGMAAWLCFRQLDCSSLICGIGAVAAALNGVFFSRAVEFSGGLAVAGAALFVALAMILRPRLDWPGTLIAGLALGVGILEIGFQGVILAGAMLVMALALPPADGANRFAPKRLKAIGLIPIAAVAVAWPVLTSHELIRYSPLFALSISLKPEDLLTIPAAGLFGHRADALDSSFHWGTRGGSSMHAGMLVLLVTVWALANAFRKSHPFPSIDRARITFFGACALVMLLGALFSIHLLTLFSVVLLVLFALGLKGMDIWHGSEDHEKTRAFGSGGFNSAWRVGSLVALVLATLGYTLYFNRTEELAEWIIKKLPGVSPGVVTDTAFASSSQAGWAVLFLFLSIVVLTTCSMLKWNRTPRTLGLLAIGLLLTLDLSRSGKPFLRFDTLETHYPASNPLTETLKSRSTVGRLALLNHYWSLNGTPLDRFVIDQFLAPIPPDTSNTGERRTQLALEFFQAMQDCRSASDVQQFILLANLALNPQQASTAQQTLKELKNHPGGQQFIEGKDDETLVPFFAETSASRLAQLRSYEILRELGNTYNQGWSRHILPNQGIARAGLTDFMPNIVEGDDPETNRREVLRRLIRQWELSSTRYFLCHAANQNLSKQIQAQYGGLILPTYRNALGLILDPVQRRFDSLQSFQLSQSPLTKENSTTNNTVELVEFSGALPRAKLFADWRQGVDKNSTADILFSPGYDPHMQVIIRQTGLPKPEMPSQTSRLPTVKFVEDNGTRVELKIPPTSCSAMLLLNDRYDPNWNVTIDGQTASLLQANNHARAVHLPSSAKNRTVIFSYHAPTLPIVPSFAALAIGLLIAGFGLKRRVTPKETKPDET